MAELTYTPSAWIVYYRDGRPNEVYYSVDEAWAVSVFETEQGRPQPYIRTVKPSTPSK